MQDLWPGLLGFHVYPNWLPPNQRQASNYLSMMQRSLRGVGHRTWVTEFGANVTLKNEDYHHSGSSRGDVQFLHGMQAAFAQLDLPATFVWHGWHNGDCYSLWSASDSARSKLCKVQGKDKSGLGALPADAKGMLSVRFCLHCKKKANRHCAALSDAH